MNKNRCPGYCEEYFGVLQMWYEAEQKIDELRAIIASQEDFIASLMPKEAVPKVASAGTIPTLEVFTPTSTDSKGADPIEAEEKE